MKHFIQLMLLTLFALLHACSGSSAHPDAATDLGADLVSDALAEATPDTLSLPDSTSDQFVPFSLAITVNEIPAAMNGSLPYRAADGSLTPFRLALPPDGFTVDVGFAGSHALLSTLSISADKALGDGRVGAGEDLASLFEIAGGKARWRVPATHALPLGDVTFTVRLDDDEGTHTETVEVDIVARDFQGDPMRLEDRWVIDFEQDLYTISSGLDRDGDWEIESTAQPNGLSDFEEDLRTLGLGTSTMRADASALSRDGLRGTNAIVRDWVEREILGTVREAYLLGRDGSQNEDSVGLRIFRATEADSPDPAAYAYQRLAGDESEKAFSVIAVGGGELSSPLLGRSRTVDLHNLQSESNTGPGYGVFSTSAFALAARMLKSEVSLRLLLLPVLGEIVPELGSGGLRVGEHEADAKILAANFDPDVADVATRNRHQRILFVVELLGRLLGALTAHEMGHALGLVAGGAPPHGLFGGTSSAEFVNPARTTPGHIDTEGFNLMEAGPGSASMQSLDFAQFLRPARFNALNRAYLQGRVVLLPH